MRSLIALSAFLDVSSLNLAAPVAPPFFFPDVAAPESRMLHRVMQIAGDSAPILRR